MENLDLVHYIEQARKSGMGDDKIREGLLQAGWQSADVEDAFKSAQIPSTKSQIPNNLQVSNSKFKIRNLLFIILALAIAVVGYFAGAYYMTNYQSFPLWPFEVSVPVPTFTPRPSPNLEAKLPSDVSADWKTYRNEEYGFEFKYPEIWKDYKVSASIIYGIPTLFFCIPTQSKDYPEGHCGSKDLYSGYASLFYLGIFSSDQWANDQKSDYGKSIFVAKNEKYVVGYGKAQDPPRDLDSQFMAIDQVLSTFKFTR